MTEASPLRKVRHLPEDESPLLPYLRRDNLMRAGRHILQDTREFCFSMDAVLLAHFPRYASTMDALDLGMGAGVIPLLIADEVRHVTGVELRPRLAELAAENVRQNGLTEKISICEGDYRDIGSLVRRESFDIVLANPPYYKVGAGRRSAADGREAARHEVTATLADVCQAARFALRFGGHFAMVHIPERLAEVFAALRENQMEPKRMRLVAPQRGKPPNLVLIESVVGGRSGLAALPELIVREADGSYTEEILSIYGMAGEADGDGKG